MAVEATSDCRNTCHSRSATSIGFLHSRGSCTSQPTESACELSTDIWMPNEISPSDFQCSGILSRTSPLLLWLVLDRQGRLFSPFQWHLSSCFRRSPWRKRHPHMSPKPNRSRHLHQGPLLLSQIEHHRHRQQPPQPPPPPQQHLLRHHQMVIYQNTLNRHLFYNRVLNHLQLVMSLPRHHRRSRSVLAWPLYVNNSLVPNHRHRLARTKRRLKPNLPLPHYRQKMRYALSRHPRNQPVQR